MTDKIDWDLVHTVKRNIYEHSIGVTPVTLVCVYSELLVDALSKYHDDDPSMAAKMAWALGDTITEMATDASISSETSDKVIKFIVNPGVKLPEYKL